jgi:hypothetical protein
VTDSIKPERKDDARKGPSTQASFPGLGGCERYQVVHEECFVEWETRVKPSHEAVAAAEEWLKAVEQAGPEMVPHQTRMLRGREEYTSLFQEHDLVISFRPEGDCVVGIIDVRSMSEV